MTGQTHTHAVHTRPAVLGQLLPDPAQLGADDPAPLEKQLQGVSGARAASQDEVTLSIFLQADGLCLQDAHALTLRHELQVLHPALDRVRLHQVQPVAGEQHHSDGQRPATSRGSNFGPSDVYEAPALGSSLFLELIYVNPLFFCYLQLTDNKREAQKLWKQMTRQAPGHEVRHISRLYLPEEENRRSLNIESWLWD